MTGSGCEACGPRKSERTSIDELVDLMDCESKADGLLVTLEPCGVAGKRNKRTRGKCSKQELVRSEVRPNRRSCLWKVSLALENGMDEL